MQSGYIRLQLGSARTKLYDQVVNSMPNRVQYAARRALEPLIIPFADASPTTKIPKEPHFVLGDENKLQACVKIEIFYLSKKLSSKK